MQDGSEADRGLWCGSIGDGETPRACGEAKTRHAAPTRVRLARKTGTRAERSELM